METVDLADDIVLTDAVAYVVPTLPTVALDDLIVSITDGFYIGHINDAVLSDTIGFDADTIAAGKINEGVGSDDIGLTDAVTDVSDFHRKPSDALAVLDSVTIRLTKATSALRIKKFVGVEDLDLFLRGAVHLGIAFTGAGALVKRYGLHGKTLVFTNPANTVVFSDVSNNGLTASQIVTQISAAMPTASIRLFNNTLYVTETNPAGGVQLDCAMSTAASIFGLPSSEVRGIKYNGPAGAVPRLISADTSPQRDGIWAVIEE